MFNMARPVNAMQYIWYGNRTGPPDFSFHEKHQKPLTSLMIKCGYNIYTFKTKYAGREGENVENV